MDVVVRGSPRIAQLFVCIWVYTRKRILHRAQLYAGERRSVPPGVLQYLSRSRTESSAVNGSGRDMDQFTERPTSNIFHEPRAGDAYAWCGW